MYFSASIDYVDSANAFLR